MSPLKTCTVLAFAFVAQASLAVPRMMIVHLKAELEEDQSYAPLPTYMAAEMRTMGKVETVTWSRTDPVFNQAVQDGKVKSIDDRPDLREALDAARLLSCEYTLALTSITGKDGVAAEGTLYQNGRKIWEDKKAMSVVLSNVMDLDNTLLSIAHTWALMLDTGPLRKLDVQPLNMTPELAPGQIPASVQETEAQASHSDNVRLFEQAARLRSSGKTLEAIGLLRDGVDHAPFDPDRRKALFELYLELDRPELAAQEARRAVSLMPTNSELRALAGTAWMNAGDRVQARTDLMAMLSQNPDDAMARSALADLALEDQKVEEALEHLAVLTRVKPSAEVHYRSALAHAMQGDPEGVEGALERAARTQTSPDGLESTYLLSMSCLDNVLTLTGGHARSLFQRAIVQRESPEVSQELAMQLDSTNARLDLLQSWTAPSRFADSHQIRILALKLLAQSLIGLKSFVATGDEDLLTDARIDLGEALRQISTARETYQSERNGGANDPASGPVP